MSALDPKKIAILDDYFPNLTTGFRISEFNYYLDKFPICEVYVHRYDLHYPQYATAYPQYKDRVKSFDQFDWTGHSYALYYTVFLNNAAHFYFAYEQAHTPFILELYPGGGFKSFFPGFYSGMDIIVSPNLPFVLIPGKNYDGFPTGCCIDAALHNVAVFCTDELNMNEHFEHKEDIFITPPDAGKIADSIMEYYHDPQKLYRMSVYGKEKFRAVFDFEKQMSARVSILEQYA